MKPYTYLIKHRPTGKVYYGFRSANKQHPHEDLWKNYFTSSPKVKQLIEETGLDSFDVEVRKIFETKEDAVKWETRVLRRCKVLHSNKWLNQNVAGYIIPTKESNKKISEFHKGKPKSEEHKEKIRQGNIGKKKPPRTQEYKELMSKLKSGVNNPMYGKGCTEERAQKIGKANKGRIPSNKGKPMSEEQKEKIRAAKKANPYKPTEETRAKQAMAQTGKTHSQETKDKIRDALAGIVKGPMSEENKLKISAGTKGKSKPEGFGEIVAQRMKEEFTQNNPNKREDLKKICPHCSGKFGPSNYARWHGDRCQNRANPATKS
jgi:hypothetical protein